MPRSVDIEKFERERSPTPEEDWGDDPDKEWVVRGIVGQSIDIFGVERYEVKWGDGWQRDDGTNTTWSKRGESEVVDRLIEEWDRKQEKRRLARARKSPEIAVGVAGHQRLHEDRTFVELVHGYRELLQLHPENPHQPLDFDGTIKTIGSAPSAAAAAVGSAASERKGAPSPESSPSPQPPRRSARPLLRRANVARPHLSPAGSDDVPVLRAPSPKVGKREALERKWAQKLSGAAPVTFVNEVNNEATPRLVDGFEYVEKGYVRAPDVPNNTTYSHCLVSCDCDDRCLDAQGCGCQDPSELTGEDGRRIFAYTRKRLFNFRLPPGVEVIECNESCSCDGGCPNRVAQRPRDVPIEVFRTRDCGWGSRATIPLPKGKVVGIYTGQLIRRAEAARRLDERRSYIFDLDVRESAEDDDEDADKFSVDGYAYGNWTRFVNHSCEPNMRVFAVVWDTIPELNQPYLAFVATQDIPARTELSIDYDPKAGEEARTSKGKGRQAVPDGARPCMCGTVSCRGWVRV